MQDCVCDRGLLEYCERLRERERECEYRCWRRCSDYVETPSKVSCQRRCMAHCLYGLL